MESSPCKRNGVDCPDRKVGCRSTCTHGWSEYQQFCEQRRQRRLEEYNLFDGVVAGREDRLCKAMRKKPKGKC